MKPKTGCWALCLGVVIALTGCAAAEKTPATKGHAYAGWYTEHARQSSFQPCGHGPALLVSGSAELRAQARKFGLDQDTPVYVRLIGVPTADRNEFVVSRVEQFGSATPVRDCAMTGVVIPAPTSTGN